MASISYLIISPTAVLSLIGFLYGADKTKSTPKKDWRNATVDILIPTKNESRNIVLCLSSIQKQTFKPSNIILIDDASTDKTVELAKEFSQLAGINLVVLQHTKSEGKTPSVNYQAHNSKADVLFVLDGDTTLRSENYIERLVQELYQGVGIACACGIVLPLMDNDRDSHTTIKQSQNPGWFHQLQQNIANAYREELYLFLQKFIYHAEMVFFGSIINPVGCAVAYRREYIKDVFDKYEDLLGNDLTTSEDIFIGFSFADSGYRNIQVQDVYALTQEPILSKLPAQMFKWSSAFLQSCYYFSDLLFTPFKFPVTLFNSLKNRLSGEHEKIKQMRKVQEAYRQPFGREYTEKYGRPIGWYIFTSLFEKLTFPLAMLIMIYLKYWEVLAITIAAEVVLYSVVISISHKNKKIKNGIKSIFIAPIRYMILMYDIYVVLYFIKDILFVRERHWKK